MQRRKRGVGVCVSKNNERNITKPKLPLLVVRADGIVARQSPTTRKKYREKEPS